MKKRLFAGILLIAICTAAIMLAGCQSQNKEVTEEDVIDKVKPSEDFVLEGTWMDETSQRATMDITKGSGKDEYDILIHWGNSATEAVSWQMSGTFDTEGGFLYYKNCVKTTHNFDEDGNEKVKTEYKDGEGAISYFDGKLKWEDKKEDAGKDCSFIKDDQPAAQ